MYSKRLGQFIKPQDMVLICSPSSFQEYLIAFKCVHVVRVVLFWQDVSGLNILKKKRKEKERKRKDASNPFHCETSGDSMQVSHGEATRCFCPSTSTANLPKIIILLKHPVNCTQAAGLFFYTSYLTPTPPFPRCLSLTASRVPRFTHLGRQKSVIAAFILSLNAGAGHAGVAYSLVFDAEVWHFFIQHNTWPFVEHSHYR